jgi:hypothetical protein
MASDATSAHSAPASHGLLLPKPTQSVEYITPPPCHRNVRWIVIISYNRAAVHTPLYDPALDGCIGGRCGPQNLRRVAPPAHKNPPTRFPRPTITVARTRHPYLNHTTCQYSLAAEHAAVRPSGHSPLARFSHRYHFCNTFMGVTPLGQQ